jgi:DNA helicase-2/ATP-dependent DNA helicase PcrA
MRAAIGESPAPGGGAIRKSARVFHLKFGPGTIAEVDGDKLTIDFDKAGRKMVLARFVSVN